MKLKHILLLIVLMWPMTLSAQYDKDVFFFRGRRALADGKYSQAIESFNVLSRIDSTDYWTFFYRGIAKYNLGDLRGAQKDFNTSVRLNPIFTSGYHYRAITESRFGNYDKALEDLEKAISLRPGQAGLYFSRGVTYFLSRRFDLAIKDFDHYIRKEPKDPSAYLNRGACHLFLGDTLSAMSNYNKAIKIDRFEPEGYIRRGRVYAEQKDFSKAIDDMNMAIQLDSTNTMAYFNRALMFYETNDYIAAMSDLDRVLRDDPGNALTLYNRALIYAQVGAFEEAIADMDRVININPDNVLAYFNRASMFIELGRWQDALEDYNRAIDLYPDFAKAYLNRSYVENMLGRKNESKADYKIAQRKIQEYHEKNSRGVADFADTTRKYSSLLSLDADFAKKNFDNELLQHRDIDLRLRPLYRFSLTEEREDRNIALSSRFENALIDRFLDQGEAPLSLNNSDSTGDYALGDGYEEGSAEACFVQSIIAVRDKRFPDALSLLDKAVNLAGNSFEKDKYSRYYKAFYLMNRAVLKAEMIDFIASLEGNVQTLSMDTDGAARARVSDKVARTYDYSDAIADLEEAIRILPDIPQLYYDLGNLLCLSEQPVGAMENYDMAIKLYPSMGDAYLNRGLVLIYLKDKEKGCIDLSRAGELGVREAYSIINKYCKNDEN